MRTLLLLAGMLFSTAALCAAQDPPAPWAEVRGFASIGSSMNFNRPASRANQLRVFDFDDRRIKLDVGELVVQRPAVHPGQFGFRADFVTGLSIPRVSAASGLFRDPDTGEALGSFDIQQAYLSYVVPVGSGLIIDAGKFTTHVGSEVIEGFDGWGDSYSRGYLFGYAEPATHTGFRASYTVNSHIAVLASISNGWDNFRDNNPGKSIGLQLRYTASDWLTVYGNYLGGPERAGDDIRQLWNFVAVSRPGRNSTLTLNYDHAVDAGAIDGGAPATWQGGSASLSLPLGVRPSIAVRAEIFNDHHGARTGLPQTLAGITVTPALRLTRHVVVRSDLRLDRSSGFVFEARDGDTRHQLTIALNALVTF